MTDDKFNKPTVFESHEETNQFKHTKHSIDMPPLARREAFCSQTNLRCHTKLEFVICNFKECKQFAYENPDVLFIDERIRQFKRPASDRNISITHAIEDDIAVTLDSSCIN
jgi:hypothetical protein